ncbi:MAG TPA: transcription-repair coupling factor [Clostridiaceae bacterium]|nr:transcription-repair coupling factor [Clostridiaceae bacterium]
MSHIMTQSEISEIIFRKLEQDENVKKILRNQNQKSFQIVGLNESAQVSLLGLLCQNQAGLLIVSDQLRANVLLDNWQALSNLPAYILPARELVFTDVLASSREIELQRCAILYQWLCGEPCLLIAVASAMADWYPPAKYFHENSLIFSYGEIYDFQDVQVKLEEIGYEKVGQVESAGQFAVRGDLLDIGISIPGYPTEVQCIRLSFFDNELEDLREFDTDSQRSIRSLSQAQIPPAREWLLAPEQIANLPEKIKQTSQHQMETAFRQGADRDLAEAFARLGKRDAERVEQGIYFPALDRWFFLLDTAKTSLLKLAKSEHKLIALDEISQIQKRLDAGQADLHQRLSSYLEKAQVVKGTERIRLTSAEAWQGITDCGVISFAQIASSGNGISGSEKISLPAQPSDSYRFRETALLDDLQYWNEIKATIIIFAGSETGAQRLDSLAEEHGLEYCIIQDSLGKGFIWQRIGLNVLGTHDVFGAEKRRQRRRKQGLAIDFLSDLKPGEYVVHENHGIGIYNGLKTLETGGTRSDYLHISYAGTDQLYISVDQLDQIQKYVSAGGGKPKLSKLDGQSWNNLKNRARDSIKKLAVDLIALHTERMQIKGHNFGPDTVWQTQFEEGFPYTETEDQIIAIDEVKADMESAVVMDRLLCGDVGFGKTEIAFRAMFKAALDSKQAVMLVPTTVLAQQHYDNFVERINKFPINVKMLSRFVSAKERNIILRGLEKGEVDIVIGTHRILSQDVKFADLGLLIIDEEQRFGVNHKESLKARFPQVDVLSMTATPIPRTLHMSISGIRDISFLENGPSDRKSVQTYVMEFDQSVIEEAILREISRGGQVFYLYNYTNKISEKSQKLREALPGLKVDYGHGKMNERQLEAVVENFLAKKFDVFVCTTIIESGLDMPNVNTIIVEDADRLGLAQLYQIRGRVGRSERQAYAYITYDPNRILNEDATKRLMAIRDFTEIGSGFKIALRDLEVRGAGNLLGAEQHGHMEAIGYELYCKMLAENVRELRGEPEIEQVEFARIELSVDAGIPESYIASEGQRLDFYLRISHIKQLKDYQDIIDELLDRYGNLPQEVINLCDVALIRSLGGSLGIERITVMRGDLLFYFAEGKFDPQKMVKLLDNPGTKGKLLLNAGAKPYLMLRKAAANHKQLLKQILNILLVQ